MLNFITLKLLLLIFQKRWNKGGRLARLRPPRGKTSEYWAPGGRRWNQTVKRRLISRIVSSPLKKTNLPSLFSYTASILCGRPLQKTLMSIGYPGITELSLTRQNQSSWKWDRGDTVRQRQAQRGQVSEAGGGLWKKKKKIIFRVTTSVCKIVTWSACG